MNEQRSIEDKLVIALLCLTGVAILCYTTYRAYALSFTHDESLTYLRNVRNSVFEAMDGNNHFLNSLLMNWSSAMFGSGEFALRLPNVLANMLFLFYSARIVMTFKSAILTIVAFLLINLNPYLLEFFSLARGYGLSMGLMMGSFYYFYSYSLNGQQKSAMLKSLAFAALAVITNYLLLNYFLVLCLMFLACEYYYSCNRDVVLFVRGIPALMIIPLISMAFVLPRIFKLRDIGDYYFQSYGSWKDTLTGLSNSCLFEGGYSDTLLTIFNTVGFIFIGYGILISIWYVVRGMPKGEALFLLLIVSSILFCLTASFAQSILFNTNYPTQRTALFYIPLVSVMIVLLLNTINANSKFVQLGFLVIGLLILSNASFTMNLTHSQTWRYDMNTKFAMLELSKAERKTQKLKFNTTIAANSHFKPAIDYYRDKYEMHWLNKVRHIGSYNLFADYYYLDFDSKEEENNQWGLAIADFPETETTLYDNVNNPEGVLLKELMVDFEQEGKIVAYANTYVKTVSYSGEVSNLVGQEPPYSATYVDTFYKAEFSHPIIVSAKMMVYGMESGFAGGIVITCEHEGEFYFWEMSDIKTDLQQTEEWKPIDLSCTIPPPVTEYYVLKIFLFNRGDGDLLIDDFHIKTIDPNN